MNKTAWIKQLKRKPTSRSQGFTLVEVMVALFIVAVAISALSTQMITNMDNTAYLRDQAIANWVALNQVELLTLENTQTNALIRRELSGSEQMAGREWFWRVKPLKTISQDDLFQQLEVSVRAHPDDDSSLVVINIILDQYHAPI